MNNFPKVQIENFLGCIFLGLLSTFFSSSLFYDSQSRNILLYISFCGCECILKRMNAILSRWRSLGANRRGRRRKTFRYILSAPKNVLLHKSFCFALSSSCETKRWNLSSKCTFWKISFFIHSVNYCSKRPKIKSSYSIKNRFLGWKKFPPISTWSLTNWKINLFQSTGAECQCVIKGSKPMSKKLNIMIRRSLSSKLILWVDCAIGKCQGGEKKDEIT